MGKGKDISGHKGKKGGGLGEEDFHLWAAFTRDITPLHFSPEHAQEKPASARKLRPDLSPAVRQYPCRAAGTSASRERSAELDLRTEQRLRRGKMPIQGRLDLHGCTQEQAHRLLEAFILSAHAQGKRCVLVITGKGKNSAQRAGEEGKTAGILRQKLPLWLDIPPLNGLVLKALPAQPQDGGTGASYVYLRRQRD